MLIFEKNIRNISAVRYEQNEYLFVKMFSDLGIYNVMKTVGSVWNYLM